MTDPTIDEDIREAAKTGAQVLAVLVAGTQRRRRNQMGDQAFDATTHNHKRHKNNETDDLNLLACDLGSARSARAVSREKEARRDHSRSKIPAKRSKFRRQLLIEQLQQRGYDTSLLRANGRQPVRYAL